MVEEEGGGSMKGQPSVRGAEGREEEEEVQVGEGLKRNYLFITAGGAKSFCGQRARRWERAELVCIETKMHIGATKAGGTCSGVRQSDDRLRPAEQSAGRVPGRYAMVLS